MIRQLFVVDRVGGRTGTRWSAASTSCGAWWSWRPARTLVRARAAPSRTIVYKGMLSAPAAHGLLPRPRRPAAGQRPGHRALALLHQHLPELGAGAPVPDERAQRRVQHAAGQRELDARARVGAGRRRRSGDDVQRVLPEIPDGSSDSAAFDSVLELLVMGGRSLPHAAMLMTPEAHEGRPDIPRELRDFYDYGAMLMEPWDGPGVAHLHRRPHPRRHPGPQRPAPRALGDHPRRLVRAGLRGGRLRRAGRPGQARGAAAAGPPRGGRPGAAAGCWPTARPSSRWRARALRRLALRARAALRRPPAGRPAADPGAGHAARAPAGVRLDPGGPARADRPDGRRRQGGDRLDGQRRRAGRAVGPPPAAVQLLQAALRPGDQPADRLRARDRGDEPVLPAGPRGRPARGDAPSRRGGWRSTSPCCATPTSRASARCPRARCARARSTPRGRSRREPTAWRRRWTASATRPTRRSPTARESSC